MKLPLPLGEGWGEGPRPTRFSRFVAPALTLALSQRERGYVLLLAATLLLTACGHRTALVRPQDIPEYERVRQQKIEKYDPYREEDDSWF